MNKVNTKALSACLGGLALLAISFTQAQAAIVAPAATGSFSAQGSGGISPTGIGDPLFSGSVNMGFTDGSTCPSCTFNFTVEHNSVFSSPNGLSSLGTGTFEFVSDSTVVGSGSLDTVFAFSTGVASGSIWSAVFQFTGGEFYGNTILNGFATVSGNLGEGKLIAGTTELTAVPLPAAMWLFGSALGMIGVIGGARRRAKAAA